MQKKRCPVCYIKNKYQRTSRGGHLFKIRITLSNLCLNCIWNCRKKQGKKERKMHYLFWLKYWMIVIYSSFFYFFSKRKQHGNGRFPNENASKMLNSPHFLVTKMPYSIPSNATLYHRKCHTLCLLKCGVLPVKM